MLLLGVAPIWLVPHVPTQDGANHVESVLALLRWPASSLLQQHYLPNYGLQPNWLTQIALAVLPMAAVQAPAEKAPARTFYDNEQRYAGELISPKFKDAELRDVILWLGEKYELNVIFDPDVYPLKWTALTGRAPEHEIREEELVSTAATEPVAESEADSEPATETKEA